MTAGDERFNARVEPDTDRALVRRRVEVYGRETAPAAGAGQ